ncbi:basic proline-rich protein-like [Myotis myotis]|uniref:basic proline-rich protein-like n=1 Tax=Myotis myotis TaxID=51298 RepID=UPI001749879A|nr:basic proline-rich protein-like [Myotis myotis]
MGQGQPKQGPALKGPPATPARCPLLHTCHSDGAPGPPASEAPQHSTGGPSRGEPGALQASPPLSSTHVPAWPLSPSTPEPSTWPTGLHLTPGPGVRVHPPPREAPPGNTVLGQLPRRPQARHPNPPRGCRCECRPRLAGCQGVRTRVTDVLQQNRNSPQNTHRPRASEPDISLPVPGPQTCSATKTSYWEPGAIASTDHSPPSRQPASQPAEKWMKRWFQPHRRAQWLSVHL